MWLEEDVRGFQGKYIILLIFVQIGGYRRIKIVTFFIEMFNYILYIIEKMMVIFIISYYFLNLEWFQGIDGDYGV